MVYYVVTFIIGLITVIGFYAGYCCKKAWGAWTMYYSALFSYLFEIVMYIVVMITGYSLPTLAASINTGGNMGLALDYILTLLFVVVFNGWLLSLIGSWANHIDEKVFDGYISSNIIYMDI